MDNGQAYQSKHRFACSDICPKGLEQGGGITKTNGGFLMSQIRHVSTRAFNKLLRERGSRRLTGRRGKFYMCCGKKRHPAHRQDQGTHLPGRHNPDRDAGPYGKGRARHPQDRPHQPPAGPGIPHAVVGRAAERIRGGFTGHQRAVLQGLHRG